MTSRGVPRLRVEGGTATDRGEDRVAVEEPLEIRLAGEQFVVTMRTPGHDEELALGLLHAEGLVRTMDDVGAIAADGEDAIDVTPRSGHTFDVASGPQKRGTLSTGACGVCGRRTVDDLIDAVRPVTRTVPYRADVLTPLTGALRDAQPVFAETGGLHAAAVADREGRFLVVREDVGRHNAVDKVVGWMLRQGRLPAPDCALVVSGRVSFELVQKAAMAGIPLIAGVSAPSSLAIETAERANVTLVAFARGATFNVYTHAEGIAFAR